MATPHANHKTVSRRPAKAKKSNALTLLRQDHDEVSALFDKYEKSKEKAAPAKKQELANTICRMLTVHATIEEEIFYPGGREQVEDAEELLDEAEVEHQRRRS